MERISGESTTHAGGDGDIESHMHVRSGERGIHDEPLFEEAPRDLWERLGALRERATDLAGSARSGLEKVGDNLGGREGVLARARDQPLLAVGVALSAGFLLAAATSGSDRNWLVDRARRQIRAALISGATAALAHELRSALGGEGGLGGIVQSFLEEDEVDDEESFFESEELDG